MLGSALIRPLEPVREIQPGLFLNPRLPSRTRDRVLAAEFPDLPDHLWLASSGTGGALKLVALSRAAVESSAAAVNRHLRVDCTDCWLNPLPLFHIGGLAIVVRAASAGIRCEFLPRWDAREFVSRAALSDATLSSLVPAQVYDIVSAGLECPRTLRAIVVGGGFLQESLRRRASLLGWPLLPSYGLTEAASQVATAAIGTADFMTLPLIGHLEARQGAGGELELKGASLLSGWMLFDDGSVRYEDPKLGGWFCTNDRCEIKDGHLRFIGRVDDLVKIRGELVDVAALERELQERVSSGRVRIDLACDERTGAVLSVVAENFSAESEVRAASDVFPPFARPSDLRVGPVPLSPLGKKIRSIPREEGSRRPHG